MKEIVQTDRVMRSESYGFSQAVKARGKTIVFVSGQNGVDAKGNMVGKGDIEAQTKQALENIKALLEATGATLDDVVKITVFITNMEDMDKVRKVRRQYFKRRFPASTAVEVKNFGLKDALIEVDAIAVIE